MDQIEIIQEGFKMSEVIENIEERWNTHAKSYDERHHGHLSEEDAKLWESTLKTHLGQDQGIEILDVGTGTGFLILKAAELGYKCTGVDISEGMMTIAKQHAAEKGLDINFSKGVVEQLPFPDNSKDVIMNRSVMWTLLQPDVALKEWRRVLKQGGVLLCFCSIGEGIDGNNHYSQEIEDMLPLKGAPKEMFIAALENAGFREVQGIILEGIKDKHGDKDWYAIKGKKL